MDKKAFTLIEITVVVVIVSVIATVALTQYHQLLERESLKRSIMDLRTIDASQQMLFVKKARYCSSTHGGDFDCTSVANINQNLDMEIDSRDGVQYNCYGFSHQVIGCCLTTVPQGRCLPLFIVVWNNPADPFLCGTDSHICQQGELVCSYDSCQYFPDVTFQ
jgi:prepilin-type N-terminal cleavage/methylation domain-containing protein